MIHLPTRMPDLSPARERVQFAVSSENLRAAAAQTTDPSILLGLSFMVRSGQDSMRKELGALASASNSQYTPIVSELCLMLDRIDAETVGELVHRDPNNALGHYLQGALLHVSNRSTEALTSFRMAAACSELRCYDSDLGEALFKAIDVLGLEGLDRLCALSWTIGRWMSLGSVGFQPTYWAMTELAKSADTETRTELAEVLLSFAGQLFVTNFGNRYFALRAVESALTLKAEFAQENPMKRQGYAAAVYGLLAPVVSVPGLKEWWNHTPQHLARELPAYIQRAFAAADRQQLGAIGEANLNPPASDKAAFETAKDRVVQTATRLLEVASSDPDGIMGPYLKSIPRNELAGQGGPLWQWSPVEGLMNKRPELFQAAAAFNEAMAKLWTAGENDPSRKNIARMMDIGWALSAYASKHEQTYPENLEVLRESTHLKAPLETNSLRTGRPYIYLAAGEKRPTKMNDMAQFVLLYDDEPNPPGVFECVFASLGGGAIRRDDLSDQLRRRGK